jgi:hypothetical protein
MLLSVSGGFWPAEQLAQGPLGFRVGLFNALGRIGHVPHGGAACGGAVSPGDGRGLTSRKGVALELLTDAGVPRRH